MNGARKGRAAEWKTRDLLAASGFEVMRAAGSRGAVDVCAWNATSLRLIAVKCGTRYCSAAEREVLQLLPRPSNASIEIWRWPNRARMPIIETL